MRTIYFFLIVQVLASAFASWRAFADRCTVTGGIMAAVALFCVLLLALFASAPARAARRGYWKGGPQ